MKETSTNLRMLIVAALFAAIIGILAQLAIPLPFTVVPMTGQTLAIGLAATILGSRYGTLATLLYIFLGTVGIPVFAQMTSGLGVLLGPTGGFIVGFIPTVYFIGVFLEYTSFTLANALLANVLGMFVTLTFGTVWLKFSASLTWMAAFAGGAAPFILVGIIKAFLAGWVGVIIRNRLKSANLLPSVSNGEN